MRRASPWWHGPYDAFPGDREMDLALADSELTSVSTITPLEHGPEEDQDEEEED